MDYRIGIDELFQTLGAWDELISGREKIHLIACGGTALTLLGYKESTKDVDFLIPNKKEYQRLAGFLRQAGYKPSGSYGWKREDEAIIFDLYVGKCIYTTELLSSPLERNGNGKVREWKKIYLGVLNPIDLIISKMFRGSGTDIEDSLILLKHEKINFQRLEKRYKETAKYDVSEERVLINFKVLASRFKDKETGRS